MAAARQKQPQKQELGLSELPSETIVFVIYFGAGANEAAALIVEP